MILVFSFFITFLSGIVYASDNNTINIQFIAEDTGSNILSFETSKIADLLMALLTLSGERTMHYQCAEYSFPGNKHELNNVMMVMQHKESCSFSCYISALNYLHMMKQDIALAYKDKIENEIKDILDEIVKYIDQETILMKCEEIHDVQVRTNLLLILQDPDIIQRVLSNNAKVIQYERDRYFDRYSPYIFGRLDDNIDNKKNINIIIDTTTGTIEQFNTIRDEYIRKVSRNYIIAQEYSKNTRVSLYDRQTKTKECYENCIYIDKQSCFGDMHTTDKKFITFDDKTETINNVDFVNFFSNFYNDTPQDDFKEEKFDFHRMKLPITQTKTIIIGQHGLFLHEKGNQEIRPLFLLKNKEYFFFSDHNLFFLEPDDHSKNEIHCIELNTIRTIKKQLDIVKNQLIFDYYRNITLIFMLTHPFVHLLKKTKTYVMQHPALSFFAALVFPSIYFTFMRYGQKKDCFKDQQDIFTNQQNIKNFKNRQDIFDALHDLFNISQKDFQHVFTVFQEKIISWQEQKKLKQNPCLINAPHCDRCGCTPLFGTILCASSAMESGAHKEPEIKERFKTVVLWLVHNTHLDYRVPFDTYYGTFKKRINNHILSTNFSRTRYVSGFKKSKFFDDCRYFFGNNESEQEEFNNFKTEIEQHTSKCDLGCHVFVNNNKSNFIICNMTN